MPDPDARSRYIPVSLITGASGNLGNAISHQFCEAGYRVTLNDGHGVEKAVVAAKMCDIDGGPFDAGIDRHPSGTGVAMASCRIRKRAIQLASLKRHFVQPDHEIFALSAVQVAQIQPRKSFSRQEE